MKKALGTSSVALVAIILAACLFFLPAEVEATETVASGTCGDNLTWTLDDEGTLTISGIGTMKDYTSSATMPWYPIRSSVKSVIIEDGVASIGEYAFYDCYCLTSATLGCSVTVIGANAFSDCYSLTSISISNSVRIICDCAFFGCTSLKYAVIPNGVTRIGRYAFYGCTGLENVTIPESVTSIDSDAFYDCNSLEYNVYNNAKYLGNSDNSYLALITYTSQNITSCKIHKDTKVIGGSAFDGCNRLTDISIPDSVTTINSFAFSSCYSLTSITIPDSVTSIDSSAFYNCTSLEYNVYNNAKYLGNSENLFLVLITYTSQNITSCKIHENSKVIGGSAFYFCTSLTSITIPDSVSSIGDSAFNGCSRLTSITIPDSVSSIGDSAFNGCSRLTSITIPDSVSSIGDSAFNGCSRLTSITIPDSVSSIGDSAFNGCSRLTSITIPDSVSSIGDSAFNCCTRLTKVTIGNGVTSIGDFAFGGCTMLESITIPDGVIDIGAWAFHNCIGLKSITIPDSVTSIGGYAFYNCSNLSGVTIGNGINCIGSWAFHSCTGLNAVFITDVVAWCSVDFRDFYSNPLCYAKKLYLNGELVKDLVVPKSVTRIGDFVFCNCKCLIRIYFEGDAPDFEENSFRNVTATAYFQENNESWTAQIMRDYGGLITWAVAVHEHTYAEAERTDATCIEDGYIIWSCECGDTYTEKLTATSHSYGDWTQVKTPTTEENGLEVCICGNCGEEKQREVAKLEPACTKDNGNALIIVAVVGTLIGTLIGAAAAVLVMKKKK